MVEFEKVHLYDCGDLAEMIAWDKKVRIDSDFLIGWDDNYNALYLSPYTPMKDIVASIHLEREGVFDWAIPQSQWEKYNDGLDRAIWFYPKSGQPDHVFGRAMTYREIIQRLRQAFEDWQWLTKQFEFHYCEECGGDVEDHLVSHGMFGPVARCRVEVFFTHENVADCYTVILDEEYVFGMSVNPLAANGFNQFAGDGQEMIRNIRKMEEEGRYEWVNFHNLPIDVQKAIRQRYD